MITVPPGAALSIRVLFTIWIAVPSGVVSARVTIPPVLEFSSIRQFSMIAA